MNEQQLSIAIEDVLVSRNPRHMQIAQAALSPGYFLRAAKLLKGLSGRILIGTGFPVAATFETDGPLGAIALYRALETLGSEPWLACGPPLSNALDPDFRVLALPMGNITTAEAEAVKHLEQLQPQAIVSIERPGLAADNRYYNMRGEDITARSACFDPYLRLAQCPSIAIGDGGNEIGMGNIASALADLDINASITECDELLVADVSNWGAYGLIALLAYWAKIDLLGQFSPTEILAYLSARGSVDGVTRENTLTEDGMDLAEGTSVIQQLRQLTGFIDQ